MNKPLKNGDRSPPLFTRIRFPQGLDVCWAGAHPGQKGFCFGFEDGRLLFTDVEGKARGRPGKGSVSGEAVNGVAQVGTWVAVSTKQEVNFWPLPGTEGGHKNGCAFAHGAHGITTTPGGYFIAGLGRTGIMAVRPPIRSDTNVIAYSAEKEGLYAYHVISLRAHDGSDVLACSARSGGVTAVEFTAPRKKHSMSTITFNDLDIVDLCPLQHGTNSLATAALSRDGSLVLFQDVFRDKRPITMKYETVEGIAYRVLSCRGDIFVQTSKALYMLAKLAARFVSGASLEGPTTPVLVIPMEGVDANLSGDDWLLVVMRDEVRRFDVRLMHDSTPRSISQGEIRESVTRALDVSPKRHRVAQVSKDLAVAG